ncbi:sigma-70 family RNA polymerase sigma factor [Ornithinibacillus halotolerans]|uniref:DNA-directed RNA polymerase sigma-70 factor n=1 Tax=Ornithinibacillus halotolerans TaxID=1274357 RepID=A0A916RTG6_9BACI|nr:sigma-70 family RNA polymerase sigma factor [Ornithinibacillus halotolerans]GGA66549.1 DNA-directed RNA polymerase sigma-70 factor [Ornithinibacillus halotolerans]
MKITSDNFIKQFKKKKEAALEYVIDTYIGVVKAVIYNNINIKKDTHLIEECISDTFLGAFDNARQFKGDSEDFKKWLCTIAKYKAIDMQRKIARSPLTTEMDEATHAVKSAEEEFFTRENTIELLNMMSELEQMDRDIFTMKYFLNMQNQEIADSLGITKAAVDNRLYRGKKRLRKFSLGGSIHEKTV